jgi:predicted ATPase
MKRCPQCRRDFYDDSLFFCVDDGTALLEGPAASEVRTVAFGQAGAWGEQPTERQPHLSCLLDLHLSDSLAGTSEPIVGRTSELEEIETLLHNSDLRLVTLTGIGGTGKTRLAKEAGRRVREYFPAGVFFIELQAVNDPEMVTAAIAHALGINEEGVKSVSDILSLTLRDQNALLILDNFEQVIEAGVHIASLMRAAPKIKFLATSREPLKISAEHEYRVRPLGVPSSTGTLDALELLKFDAVKLFVERAKRASAGFEFSDENAAAVASICGSLDGLPLALELAAARTRVLSANEILARLDDRLALLTGGSRDLPGRQQTMRAAIEWSCSLLDENERYILGAIAVFESGFTFKAAEAVVSQDHETLDVITSLTEKSLLMSKRSKSGELRFWMLQLVRDYAFGLLAEGGDEHELRRRHSEYFLSVAREAEPKLRTPETAEWLNILETEHDNLRAALRWSIGNDPELAVGIAAALSEFWTIHGHIREAEHWLDEVLGRYNARNTEVRWTVQTALGTIKQFRGDLPKALSLYSDALETGRALNDQHRVARSLRGVAAVEYIGFDYEHAVDHTNEALKITRAIGDDFGTAAALARLGDIALAQKNADEAVRFTSESLELFRQVGYIQGVAAKLSNLAAAEVMRGNLQDAESNLRESLNICLEIRDTTIVFLVLDGFAAVRAHQGNYQSAARVAGAAGKMRNALGMLGEPADESLKNTYLNELERNLEPSELERLLSEGERMSLEEVAAFVLGENT